MRCISKITHGGGGYSSSSLKQAFKPLIASSLALALGVSVVSGAGASTTCTSTNGSSMAICGNGTDISQTLGITWNGLNGGTNIYQPTTSSTPIKNLVFEFGSSDTHSGNADNYTATINGTSLTIAGNGKSLQMDDGTGTLSVHFKEATGKTFAISTNGFKGNIEIVGGGGFFGTFGADFIGDINIGTQTQYGDVQGNTPNDKKSRSKLVFGGDYTGNMRMGIGFDNEITFTKENVNFFGNLTATNDYGSFGEAINKIIFEKSATIGEAGKNHQIIAKKGENNITFQGTTNTLNSSIITEYDSSIYDNWRATFQNYLIFDTTSVTNVLLGKIHNGGGKNKIEFKNTSGTSTIGSSATRTSNIIESTFGENEIIFSGNVESKIIGNILASGNEYAGQKAVNRITFNSGTGTQSIEGHVIAESGKNGIGGSNTIDFGSSTRSTITGNVETNNDFGNANTIVNFNGSGINTIQGGVLTHGGDTTIEFKGTTGSSTIGSNATKQIDVIKSQYGKNTIQFSGGVTSQILGNILASGSDLLNGKAINKITFASGAGAQRIEGNVVASSGVNGSQGTNTITFASSTSSTISGDIYSKLENTTSGINEIAFAGTGANTIAGTIKTEYNGSNTVDFQGTGTNTIKGIISNYGGTTNITFANATANTITGFNGQDNDAGGIYTNGGNTTITFNGGTNTINGKLHNDNSSTTTGLGTNSIINQGGTLTLNLKAGTLSTGDVWQRVYGYKTIFNVKSASSSLQISKLLIDGNGDSNKGVDINFENGGTLTLTSGATLTHNETYNFSYAKLAIEFGGSGNATINGDITTQKNALANITFNGTQTNTIQGNLQTDAQGNAQITLANNETNLILKGKSGNATTTHKITSLIATDSGSNILTLDNSTTSNGAMDTTIHSVSNGENLAVILKGQGNAGGTDKSVTLTFDNAGGTTLKSVALHTDATTANALAFNAGNNKILNDISVGSGQDLSINLSGTNTSLDLAGFSKGSGSANVVVNGGSSTLSGGAIDATKLSFKGASTLTINNSSASFTDISVDAGSSTLAGIALNGSNLTFVADNTSLTLNNAGDSFALVDTSSASIDGATLIIGRNLDASIAKLSGNNLIVDFNRQGGGSGKLSILDDSDDAQDLKSITLKSVKVTSGTNNTLDLSSLKTVQIESVNVSANQELIFKLKDTSLSFVNNSPSGGITKIAVADTTSGATIAGTTVSASELEMSGTNAKVIFTATQTTVDNLNAQASGKNELVIGNSGTTSLTIGTTNSTLSSVELKGQNATLAINGGKQSIGTLTTGATDKTDTTKGNILSFANNTISIGEISNASSNQINLTLDNSTLSLGSSSTITSLTTNGNAVINLAVGHNGSNMITRAGNDAPTRNKLTITTLDGDLSANVFVSKKLTDQIQIDNVTTSNGKSTLTLYARGNASEIVSITREDKVLVADTSNNSAKGKVDVIGGVSDLGGLVIELDVKEDTLGSGLWYVGKSVVKGVDTSFQEVASTALAVNYDLYLANFNSLNKRMGELRENPYSNGVWARVFGGNMSSDFGSGSKTDYVTAQAGYDYSLSVGENAKNFIGIALAYGSSWTKANDGVGLTNATLDNIDSKMVEVGIYNSYVADSGWYNDTIFKFDYIMSDFDISVQGGGSSTHSTNNFAMVLSDEFGYRYKFAENEKGNWYIDPQVEVAFGYFNQSDFNQAIADNFTTVEASQDAILTLRTRAGLSLGKKFNTERGFASLYVGAFYEYDYIDGGNAQTQTLGISNTLDKLESNGRAIVNVGSNIGLTENARLYIDVEKSFGDKQRTFMQFNLGARYSF